MRASVLGFIAVIAVIAVLITGLIIAPQFIPASAIQGGLVQLVERKTGQKLVVDGATSLTLFPRPGVSFADVRLIDPNASEDTPVMRAAHLNASLDLWPLLSQKLVLGTLTLDKPVLVLRLPQTGSAAWPFAALPGRPAAKQRESVPGRIMRAGFGGFATADLHLTRLNIADGALIYEMPGGKRGEASAINLTLDWPAGQRPLSVDGSFIWRGERLLVQGTTQLPERFGMVIADIPVALKLSGALGMFSLRGALVPGQSQPGSEAQNIALRGHLKITTNALGEALAWLGAKITPDIDAASLSGELHADQHVAKLSDAVLQLDDMQAKGVLTLERQPGVPPHLSGALDFDRLDLARFVLVPAARKSAQAATPAKGWMSAKAATPGAQAALSAPNLTPLASALRQFDAELAITAAQTRYHALAGRDLHSQITLRTGVLSADARFAEFYDGAAKARLGVDARGQMPILSGALDIDGADALALFKAASGFDWISGKATLRLTLASGGARWDVIRRKLRGEAAMRIDQGALEGLDLPDMLHMLQQGDLSGNFERDAASRTPFTVLQANWRIADGVASTDDLALSGPAVAAKGHGTLNLIAEKMDIRLVPEVDATAAGGAGAVSVPICMRGAWSDPKILPDIDQVLKDPKSAVKSAKSFGKAVEKLTGGKVTSEEFGRALDSLFGGGNHPLEQRPFDASKAR